MVKMPEGVTSLFRGDRACFVWRVGFFPIVRKPTKIPRPCHYLSCPETDRAGENNHVKIQNLGGGEMCLL